jgi:hypothetical protein
MCVIHYYFNINNSRNKNIIIFIFLLYSCSYNYCAQYTQLELIHKVTTDAPNVKAAACGGGVTPPSAAVCIPNNATVITVEILHQRHKTDFAVNPSFPLDLSKPQYNTHIINAQIKYHKYGCKKFI